MNNTNSQKYELAPNTIEKKSLENKEFCEIYDFQRMVKVSKTQKDIIEMTLNLIKNLEKNFAVH